MAEPIDLWVLSDGRAGHDVQSLGLADAVSRRRPTRVHVLDTCLPRWAAVLPPIVAHQIGRMVPDWPNFAIASAQPPGSANILISTGRRAGLIAAGIRRRSGVKAVQILDPKLGPNAFDLLVLPDHDRGIAANVLKTVGALNRLTQEAVRDAAKEWTDRMPAPGGLRLAVLVGGPSKSATFNDTDVDRLIRSLVRLMGEHDMIITTSRRTPDGLASALRAALPDTALVWTPDGENPYPALLGHAEAVLVTEDSVNMASEAATFGLPIHVFPVTSVAPKLAAFHRQLAKHGASRRFEGEITVWDYVPLAETNRIANEILNRLAL